MRFVTLVQTAVVGVVVATAPQVHAQTDGRGNSGGDRGGYGDAGPQFDANGLPATGVAAPVGVQVAGVLNRATRVCRSVPDEYAIDCMIVFFRQARSVASQAGRYADVHGALGDAITKLERLQKANADGARPPIRVQGEPGSNAPPTPRMQAIKPAAVSQARTQAAAIVAEAETRLLRSSSSQSDLKLEYVRIAQALGSNKVLLRS